MWCVCMWVRVVQYTECPKIYRKSILHLLKFTANLYLGRCSTYFALNFGTLNTYNASFREPTTNCFLKGGSCC